MNIEDLWWQCWNLGGISPRMVESLLGAGELELVIRAAQERADWFCAKAAARELSTAGESERALELLDPFVHAGWEAAEWLSAEIMVRRGEADDALTMLRPDVAGLNSGETCRKYAQLLVQAGRVDEAIDVMVPHLGESWLLTALVEMTEGQGRDERVLELLAPRAEEEWDEEDGPEWDGNAQCLDDGWDREVLRARVLERAGRADEAIRGLSACVAVGRHHTLNLYEAYAELLARNGRLEELRTLVAGPRGGSAVEAFAGALERLGRAAEAEAVVRERIDAHDHSGDRGALMALLARQGRVDEAVEAGRPTFHYFDCGSHLQWTLDLLVEDGRPERAPALLDELRHADTYADDHPVLDPARRIRLLGAAGQYAEAIAGATALDQHEPGERDVLLAQLLDGDGRPEEAVILLRSSPYRFAPGPLAELLIRQGRPAEAIAALPTIAEERAAAEQRERETKRHRDRGPLNGATTGGTP
ncbi:tetratricopeptide repeat protein [Kitasatospora sp. NPDC058048]|uniref:tetratricopeptide repeat protein n=1 Tax=Kitasatospora sp. NPDC058048 TaxID=3346313 RepID=UPI0036DA1230